MKINKLIPVIILLITLSTTASASDISPISLNDYIGEYNIHFNTNLPFNSAMILDPFTQQWISVIVTPNSLTVSKDLITPEVYLFPSSFDIADIYNIISDNEISLQDHIELTWKWFFMNKVWVE